MAGDVGDWLDAQVCDHRLDGLSRGQGLAILAKVLVRLLEIRYLSRVLGPCDGI